MNNIQKSFKSKAKCGLRMAVGGVIADPTDQQRTPDSDLDRLTAQSNMSAAMAGLSNTERYQLANPTNAPYKANSMMGGTSAEASMLRQRSGILASLRDRLAEQQQPTLPSLRFADGGIINTLRNRGAVIDAAVDSAANADSQPVARPAAVPVAAALPSQASDYAAQAAALEAEQLAAARAAAAPKPKQGLMSRLGFAQGGVVPHYVGHEERAEQRQQAGQPDPYANAAGAVVDSLPYAAAQFVPGLNVPLGAVATSVHAAQGRADELPLDAASMVPGGKGVLLAKGAKLALKRGIGGVGRAANSLQALGAAEAFGSPAYADGGIVKIAGPGTGTSDDIPLTLRTGGEGMNINVSNGEGLAVLPAKTMQHPEAVAAVNDIIETTNGKPPRGLKAGASYADGSAPYKLGSDPELEQKRMVDAGLASPDSTGFGSSVGNSLRRFTVAHSNDPDSVAVRSGTATPEQLQRAKGGMARAMETDSPFDVAAPIAPLGASVKAAVEAAPGVVSRGLSAVRGMLPSFGKSAEPVAAKAAAAPVAEVAAPVAKTLSREAADYLAANAAKDAKFAKAATPAVATSPAGAVGNIPARGNVANAVGQTVTSDDTRVVTPAAAIEPGAQERTFGASGAAPAPTSAAVADTEKPANDIQVRSIRGANGKMQPEFYGKNVTQTYTGADGKPTTNWYETQAYKDSQVQAAKDKELLKTYEKWGLEGDLKSNNPAYQARGLARQKVFNENAQTDLAREVAAANRDLQRQGLEIQREDLGLRRAQEQRAIAAASRQAQLAAAEEGRKADEATSKKQDNYHKYLESVLTMPLTDSNGNVTNAPDARAIAEFTSKADATVAAMEEATRNTAEHSRWVDPQTKKPKSAADLDDTQKSWILNRFKAYQRIKQAQKGWATLGYADKFDTNDLSLLDGAEEGDYISFPKLKEKLGFVPRIQKKDLAYSDGPIGLTDLQLGKTPYDALTNNILGR